MTRSKRFGTWLGALRSWAGSFVGFSELGSVALLSLATIGSAWCSYQSARWGGIQLFELNAADRSDRSGASYEVQSTQARILDATLFAQWIAARARGESKLARFLRQRFRPEAAVAVDAWLATNPMTNPQAPKTPFLMPAYKVAATHKAEHLQQQADVQRKSARAANTHSDDYVLVTVIFAMVLFFTGICTKLPSRVMRWTTLAIGVVMFAVAVAALLILPVAGTLPGFGP